MYKQFSSEAFDRAGPADAAVVRSGQLDELILLERIGARRSFVRGDEVYAEGDPSDCWCKVISGTVRISKLLADGRRHIAGFCFGGDCFGLDMTGERQFSAEAVEDAIVMRYPRRATERLLEDNPHLTHRLHDMTLRDLAHAQTHMILLGRMTAAERVASFLLELAERRESPRILDLPMSRNDIGDYLGLTVETVCRALSFFKKDGVITIPGPHRIELCDRGALTALAEG